MQFNVIDSNFLRSEELYNYLASSHLNFAVLTDYSAIEAYKSDEVLITLLNSLKIISDFPMQTLILKGTIDCCSVIGSSEKYPKELIDMDQTVHFGSHYKHLLMAKNGDQHIKKQILDNSDAAKEQIARMLLDSKKIQEALPKVAQTYNADQTAKIRKGQALSDETIINQAINNSLFDANEMFLKHPKVGFIPEYIDEVANSFIFRQMLCAQALALIWISDGSDANFPVDRLLNDQIDINYAAYALYFHGVLTNDKKHKRIFEMGRFLLDHFIRTHGNPKLSHVGG